MRSHKVSVRKIANAIGRIKSPIRKYHERAIKEIEGYQAEYSSFIATAKESASWYRPGDVFVIKDLQRKIDRSCQDRDTYATELATISAIEMSIKLGLNTRGQYEDYLGL